jgi:predicted peptidase
VRKTSVFYSFLLVPLLLLILGCGSDSPNEDQENEEITWEDVEREFSELDLKEGANDFTLEVQNNQFWRVRALIPNLSDTERKPLFVHLHGASGGDPDAHKATACYLEPGLENIEAYVISPNGGLQQWNGSVNQVQVLALTDFAIKYWNVDPDKIVVVGYSNGGNGSWFFAETHPELFSAGIPMASSYNTINSTGEARRIDTPLYVIHGENDELFPLSDTENWVEKSIEAGSTIELAIAPDLTHNDPCNYVDYLQDAVEWLNTSVW